MKTRYDIFLRFESLVPIWDSTLFTILVVRPVSRMRAPPPSPADSPRIRSSIIPRLPCAPIAPLAPHRPLNPNPKVQPTLGDPLVLSLCKPHTIFLIHAFISHLADYSCLILLKHPAKSLRLPLELVKCALGNVGLACRGDLQCECLSLQEGTV